MIFVGDYCETALINSKSDVYTQTAPPEEQKLWFTQQLYDLRQRVVCCVPGNHEARITKLTGINIVYDCAVTAGVADKYRQHFAFVDIGVGQGHDNGRQVRYIGFVAHKMRDCKNYHSGDFVEGVDFVAHGHDHDPKDHSRSKLTYSNRAVVQKDIEIIDSGSFLRYGGYGADAGYRPQSTKLYKLILGGNRHKTMKTIGYHI